MFDRWSLLLILGCASLFAPSCRSLFYRDAESWLPVSWIDEGRAAEVQLRFQGRASLNPLSQNTITRDVRSEIHLHVVTDRGVESSRRLAEFPGWVHSGALWAAGDQIFLVGRQSDAIGVAATDAIVVRLTDGALRRISVSSGELLSALPSLDARTLALLILSCENQDNCRLLVEFYSLPDLRGPNARLSIDLPGAIGPPEAGWSPDSQLLFVRGFEQIFEFPVGGGVAAEARLFPRCFRPAPGGGELSPAGRSLLRQSERPGEPGAVYQLVVEKSAGPDRSAQAPMTADRTQIGQGCR